MRSCIDPLVCSTRSSSESSCKRDGPLTVGDIGAIRAFVNAPLYDLINTSDASVHSVKSLAHYQQIEKYPESPKTRPCLICSDGPTGQTVCLMATFDGMPVQTLHAIYRHFMVPIWPTERTMKPTDNEEHLHTTPAWANTPQWIIAYPYQLRNNQVATDRFTHPECSAYHVDDESMNDFMELCQLKRREWARKKIRLRKRDVRGLRIPTNILPNVSTVQVHTTDNLISGATDETTVNSNISNLNAEVAKLGINS